MQAHTEVTFLVDYCVSDQLGMLGRKRIHVDVNRRLNARVEHARPQKLAFFRTQALFSKMQAHTGRPCVATYIRRQNTVNAGTVPATRNAGMQGGPVAGLLQLKKKERKCIDLVVSL